MRCEVGGKAGWKWGDAGHCYTYADGDAAAEKAAKKKAVAQGIAMGDIKVEARNMKTYDLVAAALRGVLTTEQAASAILAGRTTEVAEDLALRDGESVDDLLRVVRNAVDQAYGGEAWVEQVYGDTVILQFYGMDNPRSGETIRVGWRRDEQTGEVEIMSASEVPVRRITTWEPTGEAVEKPTDAQRSDLPDAAFALVKTVDGRKQKALPHHVNSVKSAADNGSVDVPRLRAALSRFGQVRGFSTAEKATAKAHLEKHAKAVLKTYTADALEAQRIDALPFEDLATELYRVEILPPA